MNVSITRQDAADIHIGVNGLIQKKTGVLWHENLRGGESMKVSMDEICKVRTAKNNISKHIYDVGDYKLCRAESEVVSRALKLYLQQLERIKDEFEEVKDAETSI